MEDSNEQQAERLTPFRYTAALATDIETRWQDTWDNAAPSTRPTPPDHSLTLMR